MEKKETVQRDWYVVDGDNQIVGRFATKLATILMGKHKPNYTPHVDCGDFVIVTNCERVRFTGKAITGQDVPYLTKKTTTKTYERYTGYPSGQRWDTAADLLVRHPDRVLREAVRRMLPKSKLGLAMLTKLKLVAGPNHEHQSQQPKPLPAQFLK